MLIALVRALAKMSCTICVHAFVTAFVALAFPTLLWGCPAFQSDDFRIVSDASTIAGDGGAADQAQIPSEASLPTDGTLVSGDRGDAGGDALNGADSSPDASNADGAEPADGQPLPRDSGGADSAGDDVYDAPAADACTPIAPHNAGCSFATILIPVPGTYCMYTLGAQPANGMGVAMPAGCQCQETYTCACLMAAQPQSRLCSSSVYSHTFVACSDSADSGVGAVHVNCTSP